MSRLTAFSQLFFVCFTCLSSASLHAEQINAPLSELPIDPSFKVGRLSNGLSYYIKQNQTPKKQVELRLVVKFGSIDESAEERGAAHFIEHMVFRNSQQFRSGSLVRMFGSLGLKLGENVNATTSHEKTVYQMSLIPQNETQVKTALSGLAAIAGGAKFLDQDVASEAGIIDEEERQRKNFTYRRTEAMLDFFYRGTVHAQHLPIGDKDVRHTFTASMLQKLYAKYYNAHNMAVIVVGDMKPADIQASIEKQFSYLPNDGKLSPRPISEIPTSDQTEIKFVLDPEQTIHEIQIPLSIEKTIIWRNESDLKVYWTRDLYVSLLSDRISRSLDYESASVQEDQSLNDVNLTVLRMRFGGYPTKAIKSMRALMQQARDKGFLQVELDDARADLIAQYEQWYREREKIGSSSYIDRAQNHFLFGSSLLSAENRFQMIVSALKAITLQDLNQLARENDLDLAKLKILYYAPQKAESNLPKLEELLDAFRQADGSKLPEHKVPVRLKSLIKTPPAKPGSIVSESYNSKIGAYEWTLSNGITVVLKKTNLTADRVVMMHRQVGGAAWVEDRDALSAVYASALTEAMGFDQIAPRAIQGFRNSKNLTYSLDINSMRRQIYGEAASANLIDLLQMNYQRITNTSREKGFFNSKLKDIKQVIMASNANADQILADQVRRIVFRDDPRAVFLPLIRELEALNVDKVISTFESVNNNFNGSVFVFVGSLDFDELRIQIPKYLANLPSKAHDWSLKRTLPALSEGEVRRDIYFGDDDKGILTMVFLGEFSQARDFERVQFDLLNQILYQRVWKRLRERDSLIYDFGMQLQVYDLGRSYINTMYLPGTASKIDDIEKAFNAEIKQLQLQNVTTEELAAAKKKILSAHQVAMQSNTYLANQIVDFKSGETTGEMYLDSEKLVSKVTEASLRKTASRLFDFGRTIVVKRRPKAMAKEPQVELERYKNQVPREFGSTALVPMRRDAWEVFNSLIEASVAQKAKGLYLDVSDRLRLLDAFEVKARAVEVSACLQPVKDHHLDFLSRVKALSALVAAKAEPGRTTEDLITQKDSGDFWLATRPILEVWRTAQTVLDQCVDGEASK